MSKSSKSLKIGDVFPDLSSVQWIKGKKAVIGKKMTAFFIWESGKEENIDAAAIFFDISEKYKGKLSVFALTSDDQDSAEVFLEEQADLFAFSAGIISEEIKDCVSEMMKTAPRAFLLNSKGALIWSGSVFNVENFLTMLLEEGKSEEEILEIAGLTEKLETLSAEIGVKLTANLKRKSEAIETAEKVLELFQDDRSALDLIRRFDYLIPGETVPELEPIEWIENKTELGRGLTLVDFWDVGNTHMQSFPEIYKLKNKYKDRLTVIGLSEDAPDTIDEFLAGQKEYMNFGVGLIPTELFSKFIPSLGSTEDPLTFLINAKGKLLWCGKPWQADMAVSYVLEKGNPEDSLLEYAKHQQEFQDFAVKNTSEENIMDSKQFNKLHALAKNALAYYPGDTYVLDILLKEAGKIGYDEILAVCSETDTSEFSSEHLRLLFLSLDFLDVAKPYEYGVKWLNQAVKLEPKSDFVWETYSDMLAKIYLTDEALNAALEGLKVTSDYRRDSLEGRRDHMLRIQSGKKAAAEYFK